MYTTNRNAKVPPRSMHPRSSRHPARNRGAMALEYTLMLLLFLIVLSFAGEFCRISLFDQALARATHLATVAASQERDRCGQAFAEAFADDALARWLLDQDDNGSIEFQIGRVAPPGEVLVVFSSDDGVVSNAVQFEQGNGCGAPGSWLDVRTFISIRTRFGTSEIPRAARAWAVN